MSKKNQTLRRFALPVLALMALTTLAACGKNGEPILPDGKTDNFPRQYPNNTNPQSGVFN
jgi:predicted small lipoprotein YifL